MALKADRRRNPDDVDIKRGCTTVAERGVITVYATAGSGAAVGLTAGFCEVATNPSGKFPHGMLLNDVVNIDETRYQRNFHKDEVKVNEPVAVARRGAFVTNMITGTPTIGATAYLTANGYVTPTVSATGGTAATPKVGQFTSLKDENGYAEVEVSLPVV